MPEDRENGNLLAALAEQADTALILVHRLSRQVQALRRELERGPSRAAIRAYMTDAPAGRPPRGR